MLFSQRKEIIMIKFLAEISNVDGDISYPSKLAKFMFGKSRLGKYGVKSRGLLKIIFSAAL